MNFSPLLTLDIDNHQIEYDWNMYSSNGLSDQEIQIHVKSELSASFQTKLLSGVIFVWSVVVFALSVECFCKKIMQSKITQSNKEFTRESLIKNSLNDIKYSIFKNEKSIRSTPRFQNPNEVNESNDCKLYE